MSLFDFGSGIAGAVKALTAILQVLVPFDPPLVPLPPPTGGTVFAPTQAKAAEAGAYSWTTRDAGPGKFTDYYPPKPDGDWLTPDGGVLYATTTSTAPPRRRRRRPTSRPRPSPTIRPRSSA